ncbi:MAG: RNA-binding transcriptional accessory protein [Bacteroidaceae bacterium]|nr:RNA-binding transcriptional accessory protein [Bacteroidaceae bacterium]
MNIFVQMIAKAIGIADWQVEHTLDLLDGGATIPFISRYRKEATGSLDEVKIAEIKEQSDKLKEIQKRKETVLSTIEEQGKLTDELKKRIENCWNATELEDIYLPFKPKKRTRAEIARQKGLEPLATILLFQNERDIESRAMKFVKGNVESAEDALKGACDIIAEQVSEDEVTRNRVRNHFQREAVITAKVVKGKEEEGQKYRDYFDFSEPLKKCTSHRLLALRRGESEGILRVSISPDDERVDDDLQRKYVRGNNECSKWVGLAVADAYKRLLKPSIENEFAASSKKTADEEAIRIFAANLKQLLMAAPLGQKRVMGLDPGFRTGCKLVTLDAQGNLLHHEAIFPHPPKADVAKASATVVKLVKQFGIEAIAIGNGTASRETESFVRSLKFDHDVKVFVVSEDGASVYSASKLAREEFPDEDVTVRGAVSIGRRLMDPLAELVKIDPKSIGVGQYQHDVDQAELKKSLDQTVENCVNMVGVNVNTASPYLLTYISGLGPVLAKNIVAFRAENGPFANRKQLMKVPKMGAKTFEQCAGFLRIPGSTNPLDNTSVHPESYAIVEKMAKDNKCKVEELIANAELRKKIDLKLYVTDTCGLPTLTDIMKELDKPGRDPREQLKVFEFDQNVHEVSDLHAGMVLPGIISNITNFGCFVDIGVHEKGLVHISQLADKYVSDPTTVVSLGQQVMVKVLDVDLQRNRISLSMKGLK